MEHEVHYRAANIPATEPCLEPIDYDPHPPSSIVTTPHPLQHEIIEARSLIVFE
jgi:hypothetical protein